MRNVRKPAGDFLRDLTPACANTESLFAKMMYDQRNKCIAEKEQIGESLPCIDAIGSTAERNPLLKSVSRFLASIVPSFHHANTACTYIGTMFLHVDIIDTELLSARYVQLDSKQN